MKVVSYAKSALVAAAFVGFAIVPAVASADALLNSLLITGTNEVQDTDAERVLDSSGNVKTTGDFAVGDVIQGILNFDTANSTQIATAFFPPDVYQVTAVFNLAITGIDCSAGTTCTLTFGAVAADNVLVSVYEDTAITFDQTGTAQNGITSAEQGTLIATLGLREGDDFWSAVVPNVAGQLQFIAGLDQSDPQVPIGNFGLSFISDEGMIPFLTNGILGADLNLHDIAGNASAYGRSPGVSSDWLVSSNTLARFVVAPVPEPATLALLGLGLAGLGLTRRRKQS